MEPSCSSRPPKPRTLTRQRGCEDRDQEETEERSEEGRGPAPNCCGTTSTMTRADDTIAATNVKKAVCPISKSPLMNNAEEFGGRGGGDATLSGPSSSPSNGNTCIIELVLCPPTPTPTPHLTHLRGIKEGAIVTSVLLPCCPGTVASTRPGSNLKTIINLGMCRLRGV